MSFASGWCSEINASHLLSEKKDLLFALKGGVIVGPRGKTFGLLPRW